MSRSSARKNIDVARTYVVFLYKADSEKAEVPLFDDFDSQDLKVGKTTSPTARKNIVLPEFSWTNANFWFTAVELILSAESYSSDEMYEYVKNYLLDVGLGSTIWNSDYQIWVEEGFPERPDCENRYDALKQHVLDMVNEHGVEYLIEYAGVFSCQDLKPSAFLDILNIVFGKHVPKSIKRTFWMARLPRKIQKVFFAAALMDPTPLEDRSLDDLGAVADGIAAYEKFHCFPRKHQLQIRCEEEAVNDPEDWFYSLNVGFDVNGVKDDQLRYDCVMNTMKSDGLLTASLFLTDIPNETQNNKYSNLRERMFGTFSIIRKDEIYKFVFHNTKGLRPPCLLHLLNNLAAKSTVIIPQLLVRTFWIMLLPTRTQAVVLHLWSTSRESLLDLDINAMALVADRVKDMDRSYSTVGGHLTSKELDRTKVDMNIFRAELDSATSFQQKIALGMKYCDFMYRTYYKNNPSESIEECTVLHSSRPSRTRSEYTAKDHFWRGCNCWYHERHGEDAMTCTKLPRK